METAHLLDDDSYSTSEDLPQPGNSSSLVRSRRRAFRPSERLQRYQRQRLGQWTRALSSGSSMASSSQSNNDRGDRLTAKRRKLDDGTYEDEPRTFSYGHYGQVVPGLLRMEVAVCDGGEYLDPRIPIHSYPQHILVDDSRVYCTKSSQCDLLLKHVGGMPFTLTKVVIRAPRAGFDAPIRTGLIFVAMDEANLLEKAAKYDLVEDPEDHRSRPLREVTRPSREYMNSTRSPLHTRYRLRYPENLIGQDAAPEADTTRNTRADTDSPDGEDEEEVEGPSSPRPWHDDEYSLRSYVDRYRPTYRTPDNGSVSGESEGWDDAEQHADEDPPNHETQVPDVISVHLPHYNDRSLTERDPGPDNDAIESRLSIQRRSSIRTSRFRAYQSEPISPTNDPSSPSRSLLDDSMAKISRVEPEANNSAGSSNPGTMPPARFDISQGQSSAYVKFEPPL
ncbi:hypothetical protein H2204_004727 [Knufia peltigerae]|uniref:Uncharacterized protein n=1 Tax=Knufia peltigerae TaxID=1002370 RepID=A0AA39CYC1_9EURO|nr:hypothetical protein H2204_004727 [Knufia peltigerae]